MKTGGEASSSRFGLSLGLSFFIQYCNQSSLVVPITDAERWVVFSNSRAIGSD